MRRQASIASYSIARFSAARSAGHGWILNITAPYAQNSSCTHPTGRWFWLGGERLVNVHALQDDKSVI
jgi:hypothetical protein